MAEALSPKYHVVVANPPYMGGKGMNLLLGAWLKQYYRRGKADLYAAFMERSLSLAMKHGMLALVTMESWMFQSSFETIRSFVLGCTAIKSMVHMPYVGRGGTSMGINFGTAAFVCDVGGNSDLRGTYCCVTYLETDENGVPLTFPTRNERFANVSATDFKKIPGHPIAYWASQAMKNAFLMGSPIGKSIAICAGLSTGDNPRFQRRWHEISSVKFAFPKEGGDARGKKWFPIHSGGDFRKWYGNHDFVINWENDGIDIRNFGREDGKLRSAVRNDDFYFKRGITWSKVSSGSFAARYRPSGFLFDDTGRCGFCDEQEDVPRNVENGGAALLALSR